MTTPDDPYAQPPAEQPSGYPPAGQPYGQPSSGGTPYGQAPYGQVPAGYGSGYQTDPYGTPMPTYQYANWAQRVGAAIVDILVSLVPAGIIWGIALAANSVGLLLLAYLVYIAVYIWNLWRQGTTGSTVGKSVLGLKTVNERTGQYLGGWMSIGRSIAHVVDGIPCYVGYLWPLWDSKRQTFADKIVGSVVVIR